MPMGGGAIGFAAFAGVKYTGYTLAAVALNRAYASADRSAWLVGASRTAIGLIAGITYGWFWTHGAGGPQELILALFFAALVPIRIFEWGLLVRWFYEPRLLRTRKAWKAAGLGTLWSFALDAVGILAAFVVPGGFWLC
jgi:hypothetical protein